MAHSIITRSQWGALPPESPLTPWNPDDLLGVVVHHFAIPRSASSVAGSAALMKSVQRAHQGGQFTDIAYNHCFDKFGQIFEGRGFKFKTGAHTPLNSTHAAICYMGDSDQDGFPDVAQKAAAWLLKEWFKLGTGVQVKPHGHISADPTGCPGNKAEAWVTSGAWKADLPSTRMVRYLIMDDGEIVVRGAKRAAGESKEALDAFLGRLRRSDLTTLHRRLKEEGRMGKVNLVRKESLS